MDRRTFLRAAAAVGGVVVAGCPSGEDATPEDGGPASERMRPTDAATPTETSPTAEQTTEPEGLRDVVVDPTVGEDVSDRVASIQSGERLVFPAGRFRWTEEVRVTADNWGIRCHEDTVFEVPTGIGDGNERRILLTHDGDRTADDVRLENLTFDSAGRAAPAVRVSVRNSGYVDGLEYLMNGPLSDQHQENGLRAYVEDPDGWLEIRDYRQFNNGDIGAYGKGDSRVGAYVPPSSRGTIVLRNPVLQGFPNNACYVSRQPGTVTVVDGLLINNNVSAVRVSGSVVVRDTTIYIDVDRYRDGPGRIESSAHNTRGLWGDNRKKGTDGGLITGVSCILKNYQRCSGLATILENSWMTVANTQFLLDTDIECILADDGQIYVDNCSFAGDSSDATAGIGDISGSGGHIAPNIDPGDVPVKERDPEFDWSWTHPETPDRPERS